MSEISRTALFGKLNPLAYKAIEGATVFCKMRGNPYVELEHWMAQLLQNQESDLQRIVAHYGLDISLLAKDVTAALDRLPRGATAISDIAEQIPDAIERAWTYATLKFGEHQVRTGYLLVGMLKTPNLRNRLLAISRQFEKVKVEDLTDHFVQICDASAEARMGPQDGSGMGSGAPGEDTGAMAPAAMGKGEASVDSTEEATLDLPLESLAKEALESLKDSAQPTRPDQFVSKLNALTQAFNHQAGATQRLPLVPGQPVAMQQGGWSEAVVDRVMWLSSQNLKSAEIQLDPADLGRLEVRVNLSQDQAQVTFASPNAGVREALEGQMHRLRELFAQQGMNLADANVSDQSLNRGWQGQGEGGRGGSGSRDGLLASDELQPGVHQEVRSEHVTTGRGLVDYYA